MDDEKKGKDITEQQKKKMTPEEKIQNLQMKIEQLKNQKQAIVNREKERERKARTRRLIQIGALSEKYLRCEGIEPEAFETFIKAFVSIPRNEKFLNSKNAQQEEKLHDLNEKSTHADT